MVTLTIDGVEVTVERGKSILEAAEQAGIRIPTLCHDKRLIPYGSCRLCMVEVTARGRTRTLPACFNPARDGMEVVTTSPALIESRRMQLMLLLRAHPLQCPSCDAAGNCRLQELVYEYKIGEPPFYRESRYFHVDNESHFIRFNMNLCIKCGMCARICDEVQGQNELSIVNRGMETEVSTNFGRPLDCEFCGQCAQVCPVGAISSKWLVGTGREFELTKTNTTCSFCSVGCRLTLGEKDKKVVWVSSPAESHNEGSLCVKGRYGWPYVYSDQRLSKPLIKKSGSLEETDWNEALNFVADGLNKIKAANGGLAALGSERLTNEEAYVFNRFVRTVLESPHIDHAGGQGYRGSVDGLMQVLGYPASTSYTTDIRNAKLIVLVGADLTESHPVAKNQVISASRKTESQVVVIDSYSTKLTECPGEYLFPKPGQEHMILYAMAKEIIDRDLVDRKAVDLAADGFDDFAGSLADYTPQKVAELTGVDAEVIKKAADDYFQAPTAMIVLTDGMNRLGKNVENARAAAALALISGKIGKPGCGVMLYGEKANSQGAVDMGLMPDYLPGFLPVTDEAARKKFEEKWGAAIPAGEGMSAADILAKAESGEIKGLYIVGENPLETYPDRARVEKALAKLELLVVHEIFPTSTSKMAHVVLPVVTFAEKTGTFTSADRLVQRLKPIIKTNEAKSDFEIFQTIAALMGKPEMTYGSPEQVMVEIAELVDVYKGISYDRIVEDGVPWPCADADDPGNRILYEGGFPGGKAKLPVAPAFEQASDDGLPMFLIQGMLKFHSGSFSQWSASLMEVSSEATAELSREDMKALGVSEGDPVTITADNGVSMTVKVKAGRRALPGRVIVPSHFPDVKVNSLTEWDKPVTKVKIEKA